MLGGLGLIITAILNPEGIAGRLRRDGLRLAGEVAQTRATVGRAAPTAALAVEPGRA